MSDDRPVYLRLRDSIAASILEGRVRDGDPLPSVRSLAAEHGANPLTVAKAYQTFQDEGLILVKRDRPIWIFNQRQRTSCWLCSTERPIRAPSAPPISVPPVR